MRRPLRATGSAPTVWAQLRSAPNVVSVVRLALVLPFLASYMVGRVRLAALLFAIAAVSDVVDGTLARILGQRTRVGALLDPTADKVLGLAALGALVAHRQLPVWLLGLSLLRDGVVVSVALGLRSSGRPHVVAPSRLGKYATFFTNLAVLLALAGEISYAPGLGGFVVATAAIAAQCLALAAAQYAARFFLFLAHRSA